MITKIFYLLVLGFVQANVEKVNLTVYYEVLCPHSSRFIHRQLYPTWTQLKDYMNVTLVPFGKGTCNKEGDKYEFQCHHGERECYGNKIQACAFHEFENNTEHIMEYVRCSVNYNIVYPFNTTCFEDVNPDAESKKRFEECIQTDKGDELLAMYCHMTPAISYVPASEFNGVYSAELDTKARKNLKQAVCDSIKSAKPSTC